jgi:hypothetical protein
MSCQFKDSLGVPGEGFHSTRFMGLAVGDTVGTFILAWIIARLFGLNYLPTVIALFVIGELMHWYFCVDTAFLKYLRTYSTWNSS